MTTPPAYMAPPMGRGERPLGVTIMAVLDFLGGAFLVLGGLGLMVLGTAFGAIFGAVPIIGLLGAAAFALVGIVFLLLGLATLANGYGLWNGKDWAWALTVILSAVWLVISLPGIIGPGILTVAVNGFILWYMWQPGVKRWFGKA